ncbi:MAG: hypothetical protein E6K56_03320 [Ignavibacteria bacterium]|nr:MAG: hypothetical protein E6K56_03320 [Ignavibacteria bacterium]
MTRAQVSATCLKSVYSQSRSWRIPALCFEVLVALFLLSCSTRSVPPPPIPEASFIEVYAQLLVAREESRLLHSDSLAATSKLDTLYRRFGFTREQVEGTLRYYEDDLPRWSRILDKVIQRLETSRRQEPAKPVS